MHGVVSGPKIPYTGRTQSLYSSQLQEDSHTLLTKSAPGSVCTWAPEQCLRRVTVTRAQCEQPGMMEKAPGGKLLGSTAILPAVLDGCWQAHQECPARNRRVWEPCCQHEADREQPLSLQGHCVLWKTSLSSVFPLIPCLEHSQSQREGTGMGATVTDSHSQHVSKRSRAPVFQECSWHCLLTALEVLHTSSAPRAGGGARFGNQSKETKDI